MVSREHKKAALHDKLQLLRSVTNSHAMKDSSIIIDASKYIEELKQKIEILNRDIAQSSSYQNSWPMVTVDNLEKGIQVNVYSERSCPGLLVFLLKVFEELNLNVLEARVSCTGSFQLEALGVEIKLECPEKPVSNGFCSTATLSFHLNSNLTLEGHASLKNDKNEENGESIDTHIVKQAVLQAIEDWSESNDQEY